jgi:hypothetical protein
VLPALGEEVDSGSDACYGDYGCARLGWLAGGKAGRGLILTSGQRPVATESHGQARW